MKKSNKDDNFRVKQFFIYPDHEKYELLEKELYHSKNLYNATLYELRQAFFNHTIISSLDKVMKNKVYNDEVGFDYRSMLTVQSAQQTIRHVQRDMNSFHKLNEKYKKDPHSLSGKPKLPKYKPKDGHYLVTLTNQNCKVKGQAVCFPKTYNGFTLDISSCIENDEYDFVSLSEVRYYLRHEVIVMEVVYKVKAKCKTKLRKDRICGVDLGVSNFAACSFNFQANPIIIDSAFLKATNQLYNKKIALASSKAKKYNNKYMTKRIESLWLKRFKKIKDYMHKASRLLVDRCMQLGVSTIVIGENKGWKKYKRHMQNFAYIPFTMFKTMVEYKAKLYGIKVVFVNESYTSGTSFLDMEEPNKKFYKKERRVQRGIFISNSGIMINADVNAAYQIIKRYEIKTNKTRQKNKSSIACFKSNVNWKLVASKVERICIA